MMQHFLTKPVNGFMPNPSPSVLGPGKVNHHEFSGILHRKPPAKFRLCRPRGLCGGSKLGSRWPIGKLIKGGRAGPLPAPSLFAEAAAGRWGRRPYSRTAFPLLKGPFMDAPVSSARGVCWDLRDLY